MSRHLIIGTGPAGVIAAETLRQLEPAASIQLVGDEPGLPYARMALPYFLTGQIDETGTHLRKTPGHFEALEIERIQGRVAAIAANISEIRLEDGTVLPFERLLIASGAHPVAPPIPGVDLDNVESCWTMADARQIAEKAKAGSKVILIGAGFIGCIILEALASRGVALTVVEAAPRMVPRMMNDKAAGLIRRWCEEKGISIRTGTSVREIRKAGKRLKVVLEEASLDADLVITATGVRPNTAFLEGSGIDIEDGVRVDRRLETSRKGVFAAGDVAEGIDFSTGAYSVQAIQPTAADHGRIAALNMAGQDARIEGTLNMNVLDTMGLISSSFGLWQGAGNESGEEAELFDPDGYRYLNLQFDGDHLVGATALGLTQHVGVLRGLIQSRISLGLWKERLKHDPLRLMEAYLGSTQLISGEAAAPVS